MDADRFDTLARSLMATGSRRHALAAHSGALGLVLGRPYPRTLRPRRCPPCKKRNKQGKCKKKST